MAELIADYFYDSDDSLGDLEMEFGRGLPQARASTPVPQGIAYARRTFLRQLPGRPRMNAPKSNLTEIDVSGNTFSKRFKTTEYYEEKVAPRNAMYEELKRRNGSNMETQERLLSEMTDEERHEFIRSNRPSEEKKDQGLVIEGEDDSVPPVERAQSIPAEVDERPAGHLCPSCADSQ